MRPWKRTMIGVAFGVLLFSPGTSLANSDDCHSVNMENCFVLDSTVEDTCCANVDGQLRIAICTRDEIMCAETFDRWTTELSNGYNCHDVGEPCE